MCKCKPLLTKIETFYVVVLLNRTNCRFVDYKHGFKSSSGYNNEGPRV